MTVLKRSLYFSFLLNFSCIISLYTFLQDFCYPKFVNNYLSRSFVLRLCLIQLFWRPCGLLSVKFDPALRHQGHADQDVKTLGSGLAVFIHNKVAISVHMVHMAFHVPLYYVVLSFLQRFEPQVLYDDIRQLSVLI